ncbi:MAG: DUF6677 family protein [Acidobacteriota bacterium]
MKPYFIFFLSWLFPGAGHFIQRKYTKAVVFFSGVVLLILLGLIMEGRFFQAYTETTNNFGIMQKQYHPLLILGFLGDLGTGIFYFIVKFLGFAKGNIEAVTFHYGTTYLVSAGLINYLVALNAFDIARGKKK